VQQVFSFDPANGSLLVVNRATSASLPKVLNTLPPFYEVWYHGPSMSAAPRLLGRYDSRPDVRFGPGGKTAEIREEGRPPVILDVRTSKPAAAAQVE
jgi:hypothetical protein